MLILPNGFFSLGKKDKKDNKKPDKLTIRQGEKPPEGYIMTGQRTVDRGDRGTPLTYNTYERGRNFIKNNAPQDWQRAMAQPQQPVTQPAPQPPPQQPDPVVMPEMAATEQEIQKTNPFSLVQDPISIGNPRKRRVRGGIAQFASGGNGTLSKIKSKLLNV